MFRRLVAHCNVDRAKVLPLLSFSLLVEAPLGATAQDDTRLRSTTGCDPPASHAGAVSNLLARAKVMGSGSDERK